MTKENAELFKFEFSLDVLNHLGRGLYRSFATVVAEAVSNSWDAEATEVNVTISKRGLIVEDNGKGMDGIDFQNKFLRVGYTRRKDKGNKSKRKVIGRKGIGKLAMLSISEKITVVSRKDDSTITGGKINNPKLDDAINSDGHYFLENLSLEKRKELFGDKSHGTKIIFEKIKTSLNSEDVIRKYLATQFNFVFSLKGADKFNIKVNNKRVTHKDLAKLDENTQFIWFLGKKDKDRLRRYKNLDEDKLINESSFDFKGNKIVVKGFIASVQHPSHLILRGSRGDFKASINLFSNGRLRQENLFEEISSKRLAEEYLYGEIHVDGLDDEATDRFTSSREGVIKDDPLYQGFLKFLKVVQSRVLRDWTPLRRKYRDEGDIDDSSMPRYETRLEDSKNWREKDFRKKVDESVEDKEMRKSLKERLKSLSYKNTLVYQDLFILENIFREYIKVSGVTEEKVREKAGVFDSVKELISSLDSIRNLRKQDEERHALKGKIVKEEHYLNYFDLIFLGEIIDVFVKKPAEKKKYARPIDSDTKEIRPVRNPVMHTNEITDDVCSWDKIKNMINYIERLRAKIKI